jgi:TPR repeat protein
MTQDEVMRALILTGDRNFAFVRRALTQAGFTLPREGPAARVWCEVEAANGNLEAQCLFAILLSIGLFGAQDKKRAVEWSTKAAAHHHPPALLLLAEFNESGWGGLQPNSLRALHLTKEAAEHGHAPAIAALAEMYEAGHNVARDPKLAMDLYRKAAELGDAPAQYRVALELVDASDASLVQEATRLLNAAAQQGYAFAHRTLGELYSRGAPGVNAVPERARSHFDYADKLENPEEFAYRA